MKALLLATIPKSGTNLFRIALFNYLCHLQGDMACKSYDDTVAAFPNQIGAYLKGGDKPARSSLLPDGFSDFVYGHSARHVAKLEGPIVGLYRNPLDYLVSTFHFFFADRLNPARPVGHPREIIDERLPDFIKSYKALRNLEAAGRALLLPYEDLFEFPAETILRAAGHYGLSLDKNAASWAADHASIRRVRAFESKAGYLHTKDRAKAVETFAPGARFVRDGSIGQWAQYFTAEDVADIKAKLAAKSINPEEFVYRPRHIRRWLYRARSSVTVASRSATRSSSVGPAGSG